MSYHFIVTRCTAQTNNSNTHTFYYIRWFVKLGIMHYQTNYDNIHLLPYTHVLVNIIVSVKAIHRIKFRICKMFAIGH